MTEPTRQTKDRKQDHIYINLEKDVQSLLSSGFDRYYFDHEPLSDLDLNCITTNLKFLGKELKAPLVISSMTGGTSEGFKINQNLAIAAEARGIALALGSGRAGLASKEDAKTFNLRQWAPNIPIFANLGAVQLNYGCGLEECKNVIGMAGADALILHLNPLQEALQPEGQTNFSELSGKIEAICSGLDVPVIVKEVGWGIPVKTARKLIKLGVSCIDVAGAGGTSWSQVEKYRNTSESRKRICSDFQDWGMPTAKAVHEMGIALPNFPIIASGGLRKGIDLAKSLALGASVGGIAGSLLKAASQSSDTVINHIDEILLELRITMFAVGAGDILTLKHTPIHKRAVNE